jgi:DNA-binding transcriptional ArsR family regulator
VTEANAPGGVAISDPRRIRALAHPLRIELMDVLGDVPDGLTATECAARTGESVASCSFHLRTLARYGYVEPGERRGREKPWRLVSRGHDFRPALGTSAGVAALGEMLSYQADYQFSRLRESIHALAADEQAWQDASALTSGGFWATADELAEIQDELLSIMNRFAGRSTEPSRRPEGARPIAFFAAALVDYAREARDAEAAGRT